MYSKPTACRQQHFFVYTTIVVQVDIVLGGRIQNVNNLVMGFFRVNVIGKTFDAVFALEWLTLSPATAFPREVEYHTGSAT